MFKNISNQKLLIYAYDLTNNVGLSGDANNITMYISRDGNSAIKSNDINPTEIDPNLLTGSYYFDLTQLETSANEFLGVAKSSTPNVSIDPVIVYPVPPNFTELGIESNGNLTKVNTCDTNTDMRGTDNASLATELSAHDSKLDIAQLSLNTISADTSGLNGEAMRGTDNALTTTDISLSAIADALWDEIRSEHLISGSFGEQMATSAGILVSQLVESYATSGTEATLIQLLYMIWSRLKSLVDVNTTSPDSLKLDEHTVAMTYTTDSATQPTRMVRSL